MKTKDKVILAIALISLICWVIYLIKSILTPFVFSLVIAYFLDPLVDHLENKRKFSRLSSTSIVLGIFLTLLVIIVSILLPIIYSQLNQFIKAFPAYMETATNEFYPRVADLGNKLGLNLEKEFNHLVSNQDMTKKFVNISRNIFDNALNSSLGVINWLSLVFITPILVFYLLKDWDVMVEKIANYLPRSSSSSIKRVAIDIDKTLSGYVRGQFNVCFILGLIYSILLSFSGLNFGFLIGFLTGLFSFIPYVGMLCGVIVAVIVTLFQWGPDLTQLSIVAAIFAFGQLVESNFLTPKLIGSKIGLHPVWIIFGLFVFGTLFGFVGILIAVPLTAIVGVIIKHIALRYKEKYA